MEKRKKIKITYVGISIGYLSRDRPTMKFYGSAHLNFLVNLLQLKLSLFYSAKSKYYQQKPNAVH